MFKIPKINLFILFLLIGVVFLVAEVSAITVVTTTVGNTISSGNNIIVNSASENTTEERRYADVRGGQYMPDGTGQDKLYLIDIEPEEHTSLPSDWSLFWSGVGEKISLLITLDPLKDAEKRIEYAMEHMQLAQFAAENGEQDKALELVKSAGQFIEDIDQKKEDWNNEKITITQKNILLHNINAMLLLTNGYSNSIRRQFSTPEQSQLYREITQLFAEPTQNLFNIYYQNIASIMRQEFNFDFVADSDRDGLSNAEEKQLGTSHLDFDTDGDGISDKKEIERYGTDPTRGDTDGDGFWDGVEIINGFNPLGTGQLGGFGVTQQSIINIR